ncbi:hypothetical protein EPUS_01523 [Endocarpon pusillum Z07020]|uniref:NB-ARC domain-containing protein n=1 Tax=Endocarpon pusillum (strain Z07020 / HMAS-L-300199) TaxID=1263415 RepID=U1GTH1_ENDPU|nr:uncharacterized protein EPUS_01523 [Endocarpon pusillum Z07020]ERF75693.1 hypothetical protein EPUS_01523 [Endocarpon pusillum Z07020]
MRVSGESAQPQPCGTAERACGGLFHPLNLCVYVIDLASPPQACMASQSAYATFPDDAFVDRGDILARIHERCSRPAGRAALIGFGGFGSRSNTHIASDSSRRTHGYSEFMQVTPRALRRPTTILQKESALTLKPNAAADVLPFVRSWLRDEANGNWLLIIDNVDDEIVVELKDGQQLSLSSLLPQSDNGAILVTSRSADVARRLVGREQDIVEVGAMINNEATQLLQGKLRDTQQDGLAQLVKALDCIPIATILAAAYMNRLGPRMPAMKYIVELGVVERRVQLLQNAAPDMRRDEQALNSVLVTWQISFKHIRSKRPSAVCLLSFLSFFNRQGIPKFMIRHCLDDDSDAKMIHYTKASKQRQKILRMTWQSPRLLVCGHDATRGRV